VFSLGASSAALVGCSSPSSPVIGTWERHEGALGTYPDANADPLWGTWGAGLTRPQGVASDDLAIGFASDSTWGLVETKVYKSSSTTFASCTETTTWSGTFTEASSQTKLTLANSTTGAVERTGCATASDNGTSSSGTDKNGTYHYSTSQGGGGLSTSSYSLSLDDGPDAALKAGEFFRTDRSSDTRMMSFGADGSWQGSQKITYSATAYQFAKCVETRTLTGQFKLDGDTALSLEFDGQTSVTRTSCTDASNDGNTSVDLDVVMTPGQCDVVVTKNDGTDYSGSLNPTCELWFYSGDERTMWLTLTDGTSAPYAKQ
jgi:hypothetical protein